MRDVEPGQAIEHTFTVQSSPTDPDLQMMVQAAGFGQALDGSYQALSPAEDTGPRSARDFIASIDNSSFALSPGPSGAQDVTVRIEVPQDVANGGYYAIVHVHSQPTGGGQVGVVLAANIPVVLNVAGAGRATTGEITDLTAGEIEMGRPIQVATVFKNTGNYHYKARNRVTMTDGSGNQVAEASLPLTEASIIPGYAHRFAASLLVPEGLAQGDYRLASEVVGEDGTIRDTQQTTLHIAESYSLFAGIDETSICTFDVTTSEGPTEVTCDRAGVRIRLVGTVPGERGRIMLGKYTREPDTPVEFPGPQGEGGAEEKAIRFVDVYVEGLSRGTAEISIYYAGDQVSGFDENSLFVSYWENRTWKRAGNISVFTGADYVSGHIPIRQLSGTIIGIGGHQTAMQLQDMLTWVIVALAAVVVIVTVAILIVRKRNTSRQVSG
jgi:hypothetical protein